MVQPRTKDARGQFQEYWQPKLVNQLQKLQCWARVPMFKMKPIDGYNSNLFNLGYITNNRQIMSVKGGDITLSELKEIAQKQQNQIEIQQQIMVEKEQKLRYLKHILQQKATSAENEKLRQLKVAVKNQEAKLNELSMLREKIQEKRNETTSLSNEHEVVRELYERKQEEFAAAILKVQELTNRLDQLRHGHILNSPSFQNNSISVDKNQLDQLERLKKEMTALNRVRDEQQKRLNDRKLYHAKCLQDANTLDRQIEDLTNRLQQKKVLTGAAAKNTIHATNQTSTPASKMHTIVAAVEPLIQQTDPDISESRTKSGAKAMIKVRSSTLPTSSSLSHTLSSSSNQTVSDNVLPMKSSQRLSGQQALLSYLGNRSNLQKAQDNRDFYNKAMPPKEVSRPQSAMAQLFSESTPLSTKQDSFTAKVRPILAKSIASQDSLEAPAQTSLASVSNYYPINTNNRPPLSAPPLPTSGSGINLFAYRQPPPIKTKSNTTTSRVSGLSMPDSKYPHPPPPYPATTTDSTSILLSPNSNLESRDSFNERSFTVDIEALRRKFAHTPRPLKKRSSFSEPEHPQGPVIPKLIYDKLYKKADTPFYRPTMQEQEHRSTPPPAYVDSARQTAASNADTSAETSVITKPEDTVSYENNVTPTQFMKQQNLSQGKFKASKPISNLSPPPVSDNQSSQLNQRVLSPSVPSSPLSSQIPSLNAKPRSGILRRPYEASKRSGTRIRFDPLALLLDASLEGEYDLVVKIVDQVSDPSQANDEGITALHNAVCAGHFDLVKFLVHYGSDVNASDTDGWTPLHCSASCNNLAMCRFLVENGACVYAATLSDGETAADKCEELDEDYASCSDYLYGVQDKLGVIRQGQVYALFDYDAQNDDELTFCEGDLMTVLKRGDNNEKEWWWARLRDQEGYIPRNLLGMWPRIKKLTRE